jgi:hypothetical protein
MKTLANPSTKLEDFPPKLRRLGQYLIENDDIDPLYKVCDKLGLNYDSIVTLKARCKNKYNKDFDLMLHEYRMEPLKRNSLRIYRSLANKAICGSLGHQKLFSELLGDRQNKLQVDHNITGLFCVYSGSTIPEDYQDDRKKMKPDGVQIVDIEIED